jgi:hypothetical protein
MKRDAGYNDNSFDGVFLVDLQGLHYVSNKEFKNLKVNSKFDEIDEKKICKSKNKIADIISKSEIISAIDKNDKVAYCRCWKSKTVKQEINFFTYNVLIY